MHFNLKNVSIGFYRHSIRRNFENDLKMFTIYLLPTIVLSYDDVFEDDDYPIEIKFTWILWEMCIYLKSKK